MAEIKKKIQDTIDRRRSQQKEGHDLLTAMLSAKDEQTGQGIPDSQITDECLTFLFAGQDTTGIVLFNLLIDSQSTGVVYVFSRQTS
jgi:cytochrome P450